MFLFGRKIKHTAIDALDKKTQRRIVQLFQEHQPEARQELSVVQGAQVFVSIFALIGGYAALVGLEGWLKIVVPIAIVLTWVSTASVLGKRGLDRVEAQFKQWVQDTWPQGHPTFCLSCDYDLQGNPNAAQCPECGEPTVKLTPETP